MQGLRNSVIRFVFGMVMAGLLAGGALPGAAQTRLSRTKNPVTRAQRTELDQIADMVAEGKPERTILMRWETLIRKLLADNNGQVDIDGLLKQVEARGRRGIEQRAQSRPTQQTAGRTQASPELRRALQQELGLARAALKKMRKGNKVEFKSANLQAQVPRTEKRTSAIQLQSATRPNVINNRKTLELYVQNLETDTQTMGEANQMMQMDLQNAIQEQSRQMQMLSSIMKSMHDTAKAIINNMR